VVRLAVITDVHSDVHALRDALVQIDTLGVDEILCCGDLIDYGRFPEETLALLRDRGVVCIRGNHDRWALTYGGSGLSPESTAFLESLPTGWRKRIDGVSVVLAHARPGSDMLGIPADSSASELAEILDDSGADILVVGHTHLPFVRRIADGRIVANPGALLRDPGRDVGVAAPGTFASVDLMTRDVVIRSAKDGAVVAAHQEPDA
jgi:putative phosphoesterase